MFILFIFLAYLKKILFEFYVLLIENFSIYFCIFIMIFFMYFLYLSIIIIIVSFI